jgi:hypothetical protein
MKQYIIPVHSFVDLITNSSTEIYVSPTNKTVTTLKEIINEILRIGGSKQTCDDLVNISLEQVCDCAEYLEGEDLEEHNPKTCDCAKTNLVITAKGEDKKEYKKLITALSKLISTIEYGEKIN